MKNKEITQAVILCGGRGTRLKPITDNTPKPMVDINGKPFLFYLIDYLKSFNINNFLLLTGYKNHFINDYFGDGSKFDINIAYSYNSTSTNTGKRIYLAKKKIHNNFMLLYSDNFITFEFKKLLHEHNIQKNKITLLIAKKKFGNICYDDTTQKYIYSVNRDVKNKFVELGFMLVEKKYLFKNITSANISFSKILNDTSLDGSLGAFQSPINDYFSIGDIKRLKITRSFLKNKKIILIDRDGVINRKPKKGKYVTNQKELVFIKDTVNSMKKLSFLGFKFIIITNQAGIDRGMILENNLALINKKIYSYFKSSNIQILDIFICPHHWDKKCFCRKPNPGLFFQASKKYNFRLDKVIYIGDQISDYEASLNSFCQPVILNTKEISKEFKSKFRPLYISTKLSKLTSKIINFYDNK